MVFYFVKLNFEIINSILKKKFNQFLFIKGHLYSKLMILIFFLLDIIFKSTKYIVLKKAPTIKTFFFQYCKNFVTFNFN